MCHKEIIKLNFGCHKRHHRQKPESKVVITPELLAQVVAPSNNTYQESAKAFKAKSSDETSAKIDDKEEIYHPKFSLIISLWYNRTILQYYSFSKSHVFWVA